MTFRGRGPVTKESSIFHDDGSISVRISTNRFTDISYLKVDNEGYDKLLNKFIHVDSPAGGYTYGDVFEYKVSLGKNGVRKYGRGNGNNLQVHTFLFYEESTARGLTVDHLISREDNRRCAVEFVTRPENARRGAPGSNKRKKVVSDDKQTKRSTT